MTGRLALNPYVAFVSVVIALPVDPPKFTSTVTLELPAGIATVAGIVATPVALETRLIVRSAGVAPLFTAGGYSSCPSKEPGSRSYDGTDMRACEARQKKLRARRRTAKPHS